MQEKPKDFWFPAKTIGWGWGIPVAWQGWAVLLVYAIALAVSTATLSPARGRLAGLLATGLLVLVCWLKGEKV